MSKGIDALFVGRPGTGKTMASQILANELGLDLYRIDLAAVVNKHIGATEKNLTHIFRQTQAGKAVLLFDEISTLFGKRSDVDDIHDRFSNVEIAYVLQRPEELDGIIVMATDSKRNVDAAFTRHMQCIVDFPVPGARRRTRIWEQVFPITDNQTGRGHAQATRRSPT